ncbi:MAG: 4-(cytidine 5'-diphospho)-2-C-methyl-D-erythritol kinase [Terriglobales bacterium]
MLPARFRARAYAKINLGLKIVARREDGFHELRTVFQTISLADTLELAISPGRGISLELSGLTAPAGGGNLAYRAAAAARERFGVRGHVAIRLTKRIPVGAGMGGGSSDAAAVIRMLALAARRPPRLEAQFKLARELGSDVPAFLLGGTVLGMGRGDEVYALPDLAPWQCLLSMPRDAVGAGLSTPSAFAAWDQSHPASPPLTGSARSDTLLGFCSLVDQVLPAFRKLRNRGPRMPPAGVAGPKVHAGIENDFLAGVFSLSPDFSRIHSQLCRSSAAWVGLTGSGAAQFALYASADRAEAGARSLSRQFCSWRARFLSRRAYQRALQTE